MELYKVGSSKSFVVAQIQKVLHLYPDGIFGPITEEAVKEYQRANGLTSDGIVGPATLSKLFAGKLQSTLTMKKSRRNITEIIVHCTATPEGRAHTVDDIRKWHRDRGWADIGYHYVVYIDGSIHNGRDVDIVGAHCNVGGHNQHSIGVCYVGGCENKPGVSASKQKEKDTRTEKQKLALLQLLIELRMRYPKAKIYGHRDFDKRKSCPSFDARKEYEKL